MKPETILIESERERERALPEGESTALQSQPFHHSIHSTQWQCPPTPPHAPPIGERFPEVLIFSCINLFMHSFFHSVSHSCIHAFIYLFIASCIEPTVWFDPGLFKVQPIKPLIAQGATNKASGCSRYNQSNLWLLKMNCFIHSFMHSFISMSFWLSFFSFCSFACCFEKC